MRLNLNKTVKVKLTERGKELYRQYFSPLPDGFEQPEPRIDEDGFTKIQLWVFIEMFGEHMSLWKPNVIEPLEIVFDEKLQPSPETSTNKVDTPTNTPTDLISQQAVIDLLLEAMEAQDRDRSGQTYEVIRELLHNVAYMPSEEEMGEVSDGYHTFNQLYHQRAVLFATIVNQNKDKAWKSWKHEDGKFCFDKDGEWFIVGVDTPEGSYTYHYEQKYWDMFDCEELDRGKHWDGHTEDDVTRLLSLPPVEPKRLPQPHKCVVYRDGECRHPIEACSECPKHEGMRAALAERPKGEWVTRDLQRWCNNKFIFRSCEFVDYREGDKE